MDKIFEMITTQTPDKLASFIAGLMNAVIQLSLSVLIMIYSFQSFLITFEIKEILRNELYIKYIKEYIEIANDIATIGHKICWPLAFFGFLLFCTSIVIRLATEFLKEKFNAQSFFIGDFLMDISIGLTFWSLVCLGVFWIADDLLKYYIILFPLIIFAPYVAWKVWDGFKNFLFELLGFKYE
jgi:hypothetical protein